MVETTAPAQQGQPTPAQPAQPAQNQQLALLQQILAVLRGSADVSRTNPGLVYNYRLAVTPNQYTSNFVSGIIQQLIPAPFGPLIAPFLGGLVADYLTPESYSILPWNRTYINPAGASGQGFAQSITYKRRVQQLSTQTQTAFNNALEKAAGGAYKGNGLDDVLQFFGLDQQQKGATRAAVAGSAAVMLSRYGTDTKMSSALQGVAQASAQAAAGRYYGNFTGQNIGQLSQILAARGAFDQFVGDKAPADAANKVRTKIRDLSRALQPLRDIFGNDIKALVSSVQTLYGTGIDALGPDRLLQISSNIRGTMYATGARMQVIQKAQEAAVEYRRTLAQDSSPNLVFNDLNAALTYTMRTERARSSAFMSTDDYRNATMRDIVATGTSSYADMVNKAYGAWVQAKRADDEKNKTTTDTSVRAFQEAVNSGIKNGKSRTQAILNLAGKTHPAQLMRTAQSDYAQRSGLGARLAYTQNYQDRLRDVQAKHTMFLDPNSNTAKEVASALSNTLKIQDLSNIYALSDDKNAFREYLNAKGITDVAAQNTLYNIAVDTQGGNSVLAMAHAQVTQQRAQALKKQLDVLGAKYRNVQAGRDISMFGNTGIWSMLQAGKLDTDDGNALLKLAGLNESFTYAKGHRIMASAGANSAVQKELDKLSDQQQVKLLSNIHTWAPGVLDEHSNLNEQAFIDMLHGTTDVRKKLDAMSGLPSTVREAILKQHGTAVAAANANAGTWQTAGKRAIQQANDYVALGGLQQYLASQIKDPAQRKTAIDLLRSKVAAGSTLEQIVKAQQKNQTLDIDGINGKDAKDVQLLRNIQGYVSSQGKSQIPIMLQNILETLQGIRNSIPKPWSN